jgi:hypothetical protein
MSPSDIAEGQERTIGTTKSVHVGRYLRAPLKVPARRDFKRSHEPSGAWRRDDVFSGGEAHRPKTHSMRPKAGANCDRTKKPKGRVGTTVNESGEDPLAERAHGVMWVRAECLAVNHSGVIVLN